MSWLLRHGMSGYGLDYSAEGWVHVEAVLRLDKLQKKGWDYWSLCKVISNVADPGKARFQTMTLLQSRYEEVCLVRCAQGHSIPLSIDVYDQLDAYQYPYADHNA